MVRLVSNALIALCLAAEAATSSRAPGPPIWVIVVTSAAVGTLVSAAMTLVGQWLERRWHRKELLLAKAIELAIERTRLVERVSTETRRSAKLIDNIVLAKEYYNALIQIADRGTLPDQMAARKKNSKG